ncbi:molybdopterin oxidoreductase family protein [Pseudarthrobacter sp. J1763]|uniref:molybdopterin oxidoreductase family protein n=1 Tax=Pseudarthrobacter sp. J1763 TaxID=3420445 RepID=UPI003D2AE4C0
MPAATNTHCPYCALQCAMTLTATAVDPTGTSAKSTAGTGSVLEVSGREFPTNGGGLCRKGWTSSQLLQHPDRLTTPLQKGPDGVHRPISWDVALELLASQLKRSKEMHGADSVGVFGGGGLTNEKAYMLGKFARVALGTSRIDYNGRFCMSSAAAASNRAFGMDRGLPFPVADLGRAQAILLLGSNVAETMPPFMRHLQSARDAGGLVVVDPRTSATAKFTHDGAGIHLQPLPGTDLVLLLGLAHVAIHEGLADLDYLHNRTHGFEQVQASVSEFWPERVASITGVPATQLRETARLLATAARGRGCYILSGRGVEQHTDGTDTATAAINLALLLGLPGTATSGYGTLTGQGNGQGGREHGQKSDQLPGYRKITDPAARAHMASVWGINEASIPGPGLPAVALLESLGKTDGVRTFLVHAANVVVSAPNNLAVLEGLRSLDFLAVCDFFMSETAAEADLVLPVLQWAEEEGTITNLEGRVLRRRRAITAPEGARSELWIFAQLADMLGAPSTFSEEPRVVFEELRAASAGGIADYSGITYEALDAGEAAYWPYGEAGTESSGGTPRLFLNNFAHSDGHAVLVPVKPRRTGNNAPRERRLAPRRQGTAASESELFLATGRLLEHYQSGAQTRRVSELLATKPETILQIHPETAAARSIADGTWVSVSNGRGEVQCRAQLSADVRPDTVFLPFHFPALGSANRLTSSATDPISGMPEFKTSVVTVEALQDSNRATTSPPSAESVGVF